MKKLFTLLPLIFFLAAGCKKESAAPQPEPQGAAYTEKDIYYYSFRDINGITVKLSAYKGKKIMFVNTASLCSNTPQYEKLEALYNQYKSKLVIIGFPCNQFGDQEPGSNNDIKDFCSANYHISFPMAEKIDVKGAGQHPVYKWLTSKNLNGVMDSDVAWNFQKYLVDENGKFVAMFENYTAPDATEIINAINK